MLKLRPYQEKAVNDVRDQYAAGKRKVLLVAPTGAGKTVMFSDIARKAAGKGNRVLVLAHRVELLEQCGDKLAQNTVEFGYMNPKYTPLPHLPVQVGTMQTVVRRAIKEPNLIIVDEAHRSLSVTYQKIIAQYPFARVLGVTATPIRGDGRPLGDMYESMVIGPTVQELIDMGNLVMPLTYGTEVEPDLSGMHGTEFNKKELRKRMNKPHITGDAVKHYREVCPGRPAVAFCVDIEHAKNVAADFCAAGFRFEHIDGDMDKDERERILNGLRSGAIQGVTSVDLITEGFDAPMLECAIILRPTKSMGLWIQMAGRVLRTHPGKTVAYILDHGGCSLRHCFIEDVGNDWSLDGKIFKKRGKRADDEADIQIKTCPKCFRCHRPQPECPSCGHVYVVEARKLEQLDGDLKLLTKEDKKRIKEQRQKEVSLCKSKEELQAYALLKGYSLGWASNVWENRNRKKNLV